MGGKLGRLLGQRPWRSLLQELMQFLYCHRSRLILYSERPVPFLLCRRKQCPWVSELLLGKCSIIKAIGFERHSHIFTVDERWLWRCRRRTGCRQGSHPLQSLQVKPIFTTHT